MKNSNIARGVAFLTVLLSSHQRFYPRKGLFLHTFSRFSIHMASSVPGTLQAVGVARILTTVSVDEFGLCEADSEVMQHCRLMEVAKGCEVILTHQDVWVPKWRQ